jgi:hypothetical protein
MHYHVAWMNKFCCQMFYSINPSVEPTLREELHSSNLRSKIKNIILGPNNLIAVYALAHCANEYILLKNVL